MPTLLMVWRMRFERHAGQAATENLGDQKVIEWLSDTWALVEDTASSQRYHWNSHTNEVSWDLPQGLSSSVPKASKDLVGSTSTAELGGVVDRSLSGERGERCTTASSLGNGTVSAHDVGTLHGDNAHQNAQLEEGNGVEVPVDGSLSDAVPEGTLDRNGAAQMSNHTAAEGPSPREHSKDGGDGLDVVEAGAPTYVSMHQVESRQVESTAAG
jgi:hypothetical protein